jgi:8-oxo-dGTP diphosphatase
MSTFYFVRHAKAGSRGHWQGDDRLRPLSKKGVKQAEELIDVFKPFNASAIYSSPYLRCVQTVEPLAQDRGLEIRETPALAEGRGLPGAFEFMGDAELDDVVLSTHGDIVWEPARVATRRVRPGWSRSRPASPCARASYLLHDGPAFRTFGPRRAKSSSFKRPS